MKAKLLPKNVARRISKIIEEESNCKLVSGDGLYYIPKELFGTEQEITKFEGDLIIDGWFVPPYFIDEIIE